MAIGFESFNSEGHNFITSNGSYFKCYAQGTVTSAASRWGGTDSRAPYQPGYRIRIPAPSGLVRGKCLVFIQPKNRLVAMDDVRGLVGMQSPFDYITDSPNQSFSYRVFYPDNGSGGYLKSNETHGMELYDEAGNVTFSTRHEMMHIFGIVTSTQVNNSTWKYTHAYCPDAFYCLHIGTTGQRFDEFYLEGENGFFANNGYKQISATEIVRGSIAVCRGMYDTGKYDYTVYGAASFGTLMMPMIIAP